MKFSRKPPEKPGYYYVINLNDHLPLQQPDIAWVDKGGVLLVGVEKMSSLHNFVYGWRLKTNSIPIEFEA